MVNILIVEDEPGMQAGLKDNLEFDGYNVEVSADGGDALNKILHNNYHLILLDVMLPTLSGFEVCKASRKKGITTPIILLTAKGEEMDKVRGLEYGADDYITKPFSLMELLARIKAILRRTSTIQDKKGTVHEKIISIGKMTVNFENYTAVSEGESVKFSHKEFEIIQYLWEKRNTTVSRDSMLTDLWGMDYQPTTRTVDNFILKIRQKIEEEPNNPKIILTVHGIGYKLLYSD